jgi:hypothetical protein
MTGRYLGDGTGLPSAMAASIHNDFDFCTSRSASSGVSPKAEHASRSGMSAIDIIVVPICIYMIFSNSKKNQVS